ncbi:MAG: GtrA family protein [Candidatus Doudnabacteria bacterium]|nr:GtrA family protein [Candidatus Doudnabacteria bacterium]
MRKLLMSRQFVRFFIVGVSATLIDLSLLISMVYVLNFSPFFVVSFSVLDFPFNIDISVANSISAFIAIAYSFFLQRSWAFNANGGEMRHQLYRYILVVGFTYLYTNILFGFLVVNHGITEGISKVFVTAVQMVTSYLLYKLVVFKQRPS